MVEDFIVQIEGAVEALVRARLREVVQALYPAEGAPLRSNARNANELGAALGLTSPLLGGAPGALGRSFAAAETTRARPGRCVGVITGGRRCGRAAPPGDPPLCSFCRATAALVNGGTARVSITVTPPSLDGSELRTAPIQLAPLDDALEPMLTVSRKERCKGVLLGGGSCRSRVMPPDELCPWCKSLGVRAEDVPVAPRPRPSTIA